MPISIRLFYLLCSIIAGWLLFHVVQQVFFPSADYQAELARLPLQHRLSLRAANQRADALAAVAGVMLLLLASIIALGGKNWARWLLALAIAAGYAVQYVLPALWLLGIDGMPAPYRWRLILDMYVGLWWSATDLIWLGLWLAVIVLMFLPNAGPWFRRKADA